MLVKQPLHRSGLTLHRKLYSRPQNFGDAPRLRHTAAGAMRGIAIKNFRKLTEAVLFQITAQTRHPLRRLPQRRPCLPSDP